MNSHYTMSKQEIDRLEVIQKLLDKRWSQAGVVTLSIKIYDMISF